MKALFFQTKSKNKSQSSELPNRGAGKAPALVQKPAASDVVNTQLMQAIRHDLDQVALDLPVFGAMVQGLACTPPDDATLRQLHETKDRLGGLERRLEAFVRTLSGAMDPKLGNIKDKEATLAELIRVKEEIQDNIQQLQSFEKMRRVEEEKLMQAIRQNLDLVALDLPAFEAMVGGLACTPPDDITLRQLHVSSSSCGG
ncbi:unnamed protein product [Dibothriocephalus latus]|uniref:Uncharacterized protein n=1 Tax=Dibothriocephalus latus TaxID=60516 RepID=A0A3P7NS33_DIBLA|nr:unnamed protein product [Dibothriocephalus latus]